MGYCNLLLGDQSCPVICDLMDCNPPSSSVHGIIPARILEKIAFPPPGHLPDQGINPCVRVSCIFGRILPPVCHMGNPKAYLCHF